VTTPDVETLATDASDEVQVARLVTSIVVPSDSVAVAVNCAAAPTDGAVPAMLTELTELAAVGVLPPHAVLKKARPRNRTATANRFIMAILQSQRWQRTTGHEDSDGAGVARVLEE